MTNFFRHHAASRFFVITLPVACTLIVGALAARLQSDSLRLWYPTLEKSPLTPPNAVFPIVWTSLYILTGLSMGLILLSDDRRKYKALLLFTFQLGLNFLWCYLFFICEKTGVALLCLIVLTGTAIHYTFGSWRIRKTASILFIPYIAWLCFALYLNLYIWLYN